MEYSQRLSNVSVIGAAGKMGSGILLLMAHELFSLSHQEDNSKLNFKLNAIDISEEGLKGIMKYIEKLSFKTAQRKPDNIRQFFGKDMPEEEMIQAYVKGVMALIHPTTELSAAFNSTLIFEAASENKDLKIKLLSEIDRNSTVDPWFFTNTSSIPISYIDEKAGLEGRILGYHFYNPPAVQRLVELITTSSTLPGLKDTAKKLAERIRKIIVPSNDIAGFIGNGHFMRDALYGISEVKKLQEEMSFVNAVFTINTVSQKFLIRPMGIFQLCDYVGLDVVQFIMKVMDPYIEGENLHSDLLDDIVAAGVKGGQNPDGSQKNGFLKYEEGRITGVYDLKSRTYADAMSVKTEAGEYLGALPENYKPWKEIVKDTDKEKLLEEIFSSMKNMNTRGADLAIAYGKNSREIGLKLVKDGVAQNESDVNKVLFTGFFHAYGPVNEYFG